MSEYNQSSFVGGMNLLLDDTRLQPNQYRIGFNLRNRYDVLDEIHNSVLDTFLLPGVKQEIVTFGNFIIAFVAGTAWYRLYNQTGWNQIIGFSMSTTAPRYWTVNVPVAVTNYGRLAYPVSYPVGTNPIPVSTPADVNSGIKQINNLIGASAGNLPGLLVQDNTNQPQFIFIDNTGYPVVRSTQTYADWDAKYDLDATSSTYGQLTNDKREYVPIGNSMAWLDSVLYIASQDTNVIYRSVSGRPLDFVINVNTNGSKGGDATTTSYSVGLGGITCLRAMSDGSLFVSASNANFSVSKNMANNAPKEFGEYTFIRKYLFEATCLSDRCIFDSLGDTRFIDQTGVRSFNAISQLQNEGRNSPFTATIVAAFDGIVQDASYAAAILFDNYELYAVNTIFGAVIAVYDTINTCWTSFDTTQVSNGKRIKSFAKIELGVRQLFAITEDDELYTLYSDSTYAIATLRTVAVSANQLYNDTNIKLNNPKSEIKLNMFRCIINKQTQDSTVSFTPLVNNRLTQVATQTKSITYTAPALSYSSGLTLPDVNTQLDNVLFSVPNCELGWKVVGLISWTGGGSFTQFSMQLVDQTPMNPLHSQGRVK